jgi:uncharacterized protein (TIGR00369 family)
MVSDFAAQVPEGFVPYERRSPVTDAWQPLFFKQEAEAIVIGMTVRAAHCNGRGFLHGGVISALADQAMGLSVIQAMGHRNMARGGQGFTVNLALDFLASGQVGQWAEFAPRVLKLGGSIAFVDCIASANGAPIARANATFRVLTADARTSA